MAGCKSAFGELPGIHGVAVMGSSPAGVGKGTLVDVSQTVWGNPSGDLVHTVFYVWVPLLDCCTVRLYAVAVLSYE